MTYIIVYKVSTDPFCYFDDDCQGAAGGAQD